MGRLALAHVAAVALVDCPTWTVIAAMTKTRPPRPLLLLAVALVAVLAFASFVLAPQTVSPDLTTAYAAMSEQPASLLAAILAGGVWAINSIGVATLAGRPQDALWNQIGVALIVLGGIAATSYIPAGLISSAVGHATPQLIPYGDQLTPYFVIGGLVAILVGGLILVASRVFRRTQAVEPAGQVEDSPGPVG